MEAAIEDARSPASPGSLASLQDAEMTHEASPSPTSSKLPYDVLLDILQELAALREDTLEAKTASWSLTSTATDLLACSLVCHDWTLPARQVLHSAVKLCSLSAITGFVETSTKRQDLARKTLILVLHPGEMWHLSGAISPRLVEAVAACPNIRTLEVTNVSPSYTLPLRHAIELCTCLQDLLLSGGTKDLYSHELAHSTRSLVHAVQALPTLRRLEFAFPHDYVHQAEPLPVTGITSLAIRATHHEAELHLLEALGPQLLQLSYEQDREHYDLPLPPEPAFAAWTTLSHSLRQLRFDVDPYQLYTDLDWFRQLLPQLCQLQRLSLPLLLDPVTFLSSLPPSIEWLELFARAKLDEWYHFNEVEQLGDQIKALGDAFKVQTLVYSVFDKWWTLPWPESWTQEEYYGEDYLREARAKLARFERIARKRKVKIVKCHPCVCPPFFVDC